jgi:CcmD family protein
MKIIKQISFLLFLLAGSTMLYAQDNGKSGFDSLMRNNGRIYVVVAVLVCILLGLFVYLIRLDRKMSKLEKE